MSVSKSVLENELSQISAAFPSSHPICQFINSDMEHIQFKFLLQGSHNIHCQIVVS